MKLDETIGVLSDSYVHFTPEFYSNLSWTASVEPGGGAKIFLNFFHPEDQPLERQYFLFGYIHAMILRTFDRCVDGRFMADATFASLYDGLMSNLHRLLHEDYLRKYPGEVEEEFKV